MPHPLLNQVISGEAGIKRCVIRDSQNSKNHIKENTTFWGYDSSKDTCYQLKIILDIFNKERIQLVRTVPDCSSKKEFNYIAKSNSDLNN